MTHTNIVLMIRTFPFDLKPEYVDEMTIDTETAIKHKAACVWCLLDNDYTPEQLELYCSLYAITPAQALKWNTNR